MFEIGGTGKTIEMGEWSEPSAVNGLLSWIRTGIREQMIYQCPEDKTIALL